MHKQNAAGRIARYFLTSKLTPAIVIAICVWGLLAIFLTPRQENPQITMPAALIVTQYPGATSQEVQKLVTERGERVLQEVPGIEHIYATSTQDVSMMTVLFHVGDDPTKSFVSLYDQVFAHLNELPPGASQPQITPLSVDDIPIVVLTLHGAQYNRGQLYQAAQQLIGAIQPIEGVSTIDTYGGLPREVNVTLDPVKLAAYGLSPGQIAQALGVTNLTRPVGDVRSSGSQIDIHAGTPFSNVDQVRSQIVSVVDGQPVALGDVADVSLGFAPEESQTQFGTSKGIQPAVSIAIAKKAGTNAVTIANEILATEKTTQLPPGVQVTVTRNDGNKANLAVNELIERLVEAVAIVVLLLLVLGWREALVVATAIPLTLFVTLGIGMMTGQSINRITLFALILGLGLLVDQAIVIVENIHRHYHADPNTPKEESTVAAVAEIGSPTTLATVTVVLSFLPMLFVTGMMGPYMRPIPINVPVAMIASLLIAFAITPWATYAMLRKQKATAQHGVPRWIVPFRNGLAHMLDNPRAGRRFLGALLIAFIVSAMLPVAALLTPGEAFGVKFRMLPDANETSFLVSIDAPASSTVAHTTAIADAVGAALAKMPEVANYQTFAGTNAVPDLSALLQGTVFRNSPNQADIRVNLLPKDQRKIQSAQLVAEIRPGLQRLAAQYGATLRILQVPPGPPVRDTILAKIYGPDPEVRRAVASRIASMMQAEKGVVDVDSSYKALPSALQLQVDQRKAALSGVDADTIAQTLGMALHGASVSTLHTAADDRPVGIFVRFAPQYRSDPAALGSIMIPSRMGGLVPLGSVTAAVATQVQQPLYRDDYEDVSYVEADMAGRSSTYAVISMQLQLMRNPLPAGYRVVWDGEWHLTNTVFADLGRAMLIAFILIYFLLVARFKSFRVPLVVLAAVPLAVIGVLPGFALLAPFGVYFSATAMIGLIALIGIVVRNSIILIEFIEDKLREGVPLRDGLVDAATARTRPIFLTAAAGVLSSVVIASDPVWSGLAWALVFGMTASAVLSVLAIPLLYAGVATAMKPVERTHVLPSVPEVLPDERLALESYVTFPELDGYVMESTTLPRVMKGEVISLKAEVFRGEGEAADAVAYLNGPFRVDQAEIVFTSAYGELQGKQYVTLVSAQPPAPKWSVLEHV